MTKIDDGHGERRIQPLVMRISIPGVTRPLFWLPDGTGYVFYHPTHWHHIEAETSA